MTWSTVKREAIIALYRAGICIEDIVEAEAVGRTTIYRIVHEGGIALDRQIAPETRQRAIGRLQAGELFGQVWRLEGISRDTLRRWAKGITYNTNRVRHSDSLKRRVLASYEADGSVCDIMRNEKISRRTVYRWAIEANVRRAPHRPGPKKRHRL